MPRATPGLQNFNAGEFSPAMDGRTDIQKYGGACHLVENFIPLVQGPARRRPGTRYVNEVIDSEKQSWLSSFRFNVTQSFTLEWGDHELRFYTQHGAVLGGNITKAITDALDNGPTEITIMDHGFSDGDTIAIDKVGGLTSLNGHSYVISNVTTNTFDLVGTPVFNLAYTSGGTATKIVLGKIITAATNADPPVITSVAHGFVDGDRLYIAGVLGEIELNGRFFTVANATADTFELLGIAGISYGAYISGGVVTKLYSIETPYASDDLVDSKGFFALRFAQVGDVAYITNTNGTFPLYKLSRFGNTNWQLNEVKLRGGPFKTLNTTDAPVMWASGQTGTVTVTCTAPLFTADKIGSLLYLEEENIRQIHPWEPGRAASVGTRRRYNGVTYRATNADTTGTVPPTHYFGEAFDGGGSQGVSWNYQDPGYGWGLITAVSADGLTCTVLVGDPVPDTRPIIQYPFEVIGATHTTSKFAFSEFNLSIFVPAPNGDPNGPPPTGTQPMILIRATGTGFPTHVKFFRERLTLMRDQNIWSSVSNDFENFNNRNPGGLVTEDMAISITIPTQDGPAWLQEGTDLAIGTEGGEFIGGAINANNPLGPSNIQIKPQATRGGRPIPALRIGSEILFVQTSGRKLRSLKYDFDTNAYSTEDLTVLAEHITKGGLRQMEYAQEPDTIVWMIRGRTG